MPAWDGSPSWEDDDLIDYLGRLPSWHDQAACRNHPHADWWFPPPGPYGRTLTQRAKEICADCPVQAECLADAMVTMTDYGIWGGLSWRERRTLRKRARHVA